MTASTFDKKLLKALLDVLVDRWGLDNVADTLNGISGEGSTSQIGSPKKKEDKSLKPSAVSVVSRAAVADSIKVRLVRIAELFDSKTFLPTVSDVRHFLEMRGRPIGVTKQRHATFRKVLDALVQMSDQELEDLANSGVHAGPTKLGPLSDAINASASGGRREFAKDNESDDAGIKKSWPSSDS